MQKKLNLCNQIENIADNESLRATICNKGLRETQSPSETVQLLSKAYPTNRLSKTQIFEWHKRFRDGRENVESELGQGRTATSTTQENIIAVENLLNENPRLQSER